MSKFGPNSMAAINEFCFRVDVREGIPGCADDDSYTSPKFQTFADTYKALVSFEPDEHWPALRSVENMWILKNDMKFAANYFQIKKHDLVLLGVSADEFAKIHGYTILLRDEDYPLPDSDYEDKVAEIHQTKDEYSRLHAGGVAYAF